MVSPLPAAAESAVALPGDARHMLWIPSGYEVRDGHVDLLVHFHGSPAVVRQAVAEASKPWVVVTVDYRGFSSVYRQPFAEEPQRLAVLLQEAGQVLRERENLPAAPDWGKLVVSSFSAGFGAVREILNSDVYFDQIDGVLLVDSLYSGYVGDGTDSVETGIVHPDLMKAFLRYAEASAAGKKAMIVTHTEVPTDGYANTRETADYLLSKLSLQPEAVDYELPRPRSAGEATRRLRIVRQAKKSGLAIYGTPGHDAAEHVAHLRHMAYWLTVLDSPPQTIGR